MMKPLTDIVHLRSTRCDRVYRVTAIDQDTVSVTLRGQHGSFTEPWDKERLKAIGYDRVIGPFEGMIEIETDDAQQP